jgi:pentatricopeptide repeat-containing protein PET309
MDLDLPSWWSMAVDPDDLRECEPPKAHRSVASKGFLLDFLYPTKTLTMLRQYSTVAPSKFKGNHLSRSRSRTFASTSNEAMESRSSSTQTTELHDTNNELALSPSEIAELTAGESLRERRSNLTLGDYPRDEELKKTRPLVLFEAILRGDAHPDDMHQICAKYRHVLSEDTTLRARVFAFLWNFHTVENLNTIIEIGRSVSPRFKSDYRIVVESLLHLHRPEDALQNFEQAFVNFENTQDLGAKAILAYSIQYKNWALGLKLWHLYWLKFGEDIFEMQSIWELTDAIPGLTGRALRLTMVAKAKSEALGESPHDKGGWGAFAGHVLRRALETFQKRPDVGHDDNLHIMNALRKLNRDVEADFTQAIRNQSAVSSKSAVRLYTHLRRNAKHIKPARVSLRTILRNSWELRDISTMREVWQDWKLFYAGPDRDAYILLMSELSAQGDVQAVESVWLAYIERYRPRSLREYRDRSAPLLHVHARRGDVVATQTRFDQIQKEFGLAPNRRFWNILINAYARVNNVDGALRSFNKLLMDTTFGPDRITYAIMMNLCAKRGDIERVEQFQTMIEMSPQLQLDIGRKDELTSTVVSANINVGRLERAERIAEDAMRKLKESMKMSPLRYPQRPSIARSFAKMWNDLIEAYGLKGDLASTLRLLRRMTELRIAKDGFTYANLMKCLVVRKQMEGASKIMRVMRKEDLRVTTYHYEICMAGRMRQGEPRKVLDLHSKMIAEGLETTPQCLALVIRAKADIAGEMNQEFDVQETEQLLMDELKRKVGHLGPSLYPSGGDPMFSRRSTALLDTILNLYTREGNTRAYKTVLERYINALSHKESLIDSMIVFDRMLRSDLEQKEYQSMDEIWNRLYDVAREKAKKMGAKYSEEGFKAIHTKRFILSASFQKYANALANQGRWSEISRTMSKLATEGFEFDKLFWNDYVQLLAKYDRAYDACLMCESKLMDGFRGWSMTSEAGGLHVDKTDDLAPSYQTMVYIARTVMVLQSKATTTDGDPASLNDIIRECPRTLDAVFRMPKVEDALQTDVLGGLY